MIQETSPKSIPPLPSGSFKFFALDVETADYNRGSICQIGIAGVRPDNSIDTWMTYINPYVDQWVFTSLHGIGPNTVKDAPSFGQVIPALEEALHGYTVYQHSSFDRSAIRGACEMINIGEPDWEWKDSVIVARKAWPELKGNGGHGLASLKKFLGLEFQHHDAEEDARAAAEVVLYADGLEPLKRARNSV